ncbi:hypothetical protein RFI_27777, partial [Reticulomyxa filosa]
FSSSSKYSCILFFIGYCERFLKNQQTGKREEKRKKKKKQLTNSIYLYKKRPSKKTQLNNRDLVTGFDFDIIFTAYFVSPFFSVASITRHDAPFPSVHYLLTSKKNFHVFLPHFNQNHFALVFSISQQILLRKNILFKKGARVRVKIIDIGDMDIPNSEDHEELKQEEVDEVVQTVETDNHGKLMDALETEVTKPERTNCNRNEQSFR